MESDKENELVILNAFSFAERGNNLKDGAGTASSSSVEDSGAADASTSPMEDSGAGTASPSPEEDDDGWVTEEEGDVEVQQDDDDLEVICSINKVRPMSPVNANNAEGDNRNKKNEPVEEYKIITIDSDDEDDVNNNEKPVEPPEHLVCFRCHDKERITFNTLEEFKVHVARHNNGDLYNCVTCRRPFLKLDYCLSHEYRVHGTPIPTCFDSNKGALLIAKIYMQLVHENGGDQGKADPEDVRFYEDHFHCSGTLYPYRGPDLISKSYLECYEMQLYSKRPKFKHLNGISRDAVNKHFSNVALNKALEFEYILGRFGAPKTCRGVAGPAAPKKTAIKAVVKTSAKKSKESPGNAFLAPAPPVPQRKKCTKCRFHWYYQEYLELHRTQIHKHLKLVDLMEAPITNGTKKRGKKQAKQQNTKRKRISK